MIMDHYSEDSRGLKRKAEYANGGPHWQEGDVKRKKETKADLLRKLQQLQEAKLQLAQREQSLRSAAPGRDEESRHAWPQNGGSKARPMHPPAPPQLSRQASEKRTPKANALYMGNEYVSASAGQDQLPANALSKGGGANGKGAKRPAGGDAKLQKIEKERAKRTEAIWKTITTSVHKRLQSDRMNSWYFAVPVDPVKLNIPTYFDIVKHPMDLGTILSKLRKKQYSEFAQYAADVRLTFHNAMKFNGPDNNVHKAAAFLLDRFERDWWPGVVQAIQRDREQAAIEDESLEADWVPQPKKTSKPPAPAPVKRNPPKPKAPAPVTAPASSKQSSGGYARQAYQPPPPKPKVREMTMEEKRDLSIALSDMGAELLTGIVEIIKERHADLMSNDEELELDIDALDDITLWELKKYVDLKAGEEAESRPPQEGDGSTNHDQEPITPAGGSSDEVPSKVKKPKGPKSSSTSSSSGSESSGSGSSGNSSGSGSESDADEAKQKKAQGSGDRRGGPPASGSSPGKAPKQGMRGSAPGEASQPDGSSKAQLTPAPSVPVPEAIPEIEMTEEQREKHRRALELRAKYTDTIIQARTSDLGPKAPASRSAEDVRREREARRQRELAEAQRIRAEAEAARAAERRLREEKAAEERRKIEQMREEERLRLQQFNRDVELDSHDIEKEYQKIKTLSPQEESRSRSPHPSPPGSASPEAEGEEEIPGGVMEQLGLVIRHDDDEATDDEYDDEEEAAEENGGLEDTEEEGGEKPLAEEAEVEDGEI